MRSLLDIVLDHIEAGEEVLVVIEPSPCQNPEMGNGDSSYTKGCRCERCRAARTLAARRWRRRHRSGA